MCQHQPPCPNADAVDREAARVVVAFPQQGWSLPRIRGAVAVQALAAAFTYTVIAGWSRYAALRRTRADDHPDR